MAIITEAGQGIPEEQGRALVWLARSAIGQALGLATPEPEGYRALLTDPALAARQGTFVTLTMHGGLRGCIGNLISEETIVEGVRRNAINAAFHDSRFRPLLEAEFAGIAIAVSVLTQPVPMVSADGDDLISKLRPGIDGVILRDGVYGATFLPQVWEQLPDPAEFLGHLCRKAMLAGDAWRSGSLEVSTYQVQYFSEQHA